MQIWVDANACPGEIKALLDRAAERLKVKLTLVAGGGDHIGVALPALVPKTTGFRQSTRRWLVKNRSAKG